MRQGRPTSVLLIDLDKFKLVNDRFGHAVGDLTLKAVAAAVSAVGRKSDVVARWGGEELLMILPETSTGQALLAAERVRPTVSIGSATAASCDKSPVDTLVDIADRGMYAAKHAGRNRVCEGAERVEE
jgi:diguanylate cyclase (GGDEF)-like protein